MLVLDCSISLLLESKRLLENQKGIGRLMDIRLEWFIKKCELMTYSKCGTFHMVTPYLMLGMKI